MIGEFRIMGLLTSTAYTRSTRTIPYVRRKVDDVIERAGFGSEGHSGKALVNILETYPRDELFQIDEDLLYHFAIATLQLEERPRVRVLARRDRFDRFMSVLVYVPRDRASSDVIETIGEFLSGMFKGHVSGLNLFFPEGSMVRVHFIVARSAEQADDPDRAELEYGVGAIVRTWTDALQEQLSLGLDSRKSEAFVRALSACLFARAIAIAIRRRSRSTISAPWRRCRRNARSAWISMHVPARPRIASA